MNPESEIYWRVAGAAVGGLDALIAQLMIVPRGYDDLREDIATIGEIKADHRKVDLRGYGRAIGCMGRMTFVAAGAVAGAMYPGWVLGSTGTYIFLRGLHVHNRNQEILRRPFFR